jgi:arylsulfatase A-like enzyme
MRRAIVTGIAFGICVTAADLGLGAQRMIAMRLPAMPAAALEGAAFEIALAVAMALVLGPLLLSPAGRVVHAVALAATWALLARALALDPAIVPSWLLAPAIALAAVGLGALLARYSRRAAWTAGIVALAASILVPVIVDARRPAIPVASPTGEAPAGAPDIVLIVLDTVRAQSLPTYGYRRATAPTFDALAKEGALFLDATSPATWSLPAHASLFTGLFPTTHGAHEEARVLATDVPTIGEVLGANGYETLCFTANPHISDGFGLTRGFQHQDRAWLGPSAGRSFMFIYRALDLFGWGARDKGGSRVVENFERWLASRPRDARPSFAFLNFLEAHFPYHQTPTEYLARYTELGPMARRDASLKAMAAQFGRDLTPEEIEAIAAPSVDMYDAGIAYTDHLLQRVVSALRKAARLERTLLVVLADHGEMIGEHGEFGHGPGLYEPDIRVPLLLRYPTKIPAGTRVKRPVSTAATYATILDVVGIEPPAPPQVASLVPAFTGGNGGAPVIVERLAMRGEQFNPAAPPLAHRDVRYRVYRSGSRKLAVKSTGEALLFDVAADPNETNDLAATDADGVKALRKELDTWVAALGLMPLDQPIDAVTTSPPPDPAAIEQLKALGYVD